MTRELFIESIKAIQNQFKIDRKCNDAFKIILPNDYTSGYDNSFLLNQLIKILEIEFYDEGNWIDYWIYELEFGEKYIDGCITDKNDDIIRMETVEELYEYLIK